MKIKVRFADAVECVPEPVQVAGTPLRPFSLGHHLILKRIAPEFCHPSAGAALEPLDRILLGVYVCAHDYFNLVEEMVRFRFKDSFSRWADSVKKAFRKGTFVKTDVGPLFVAYLQVGYAQPPLMEKISADDSSFDLSAPWETVLKARLMQNGFSEREVMEGYLPSLRYSYYTIQEMAQKTKPVPFFLDQETAEGLEEMRNGS